MPRVSGTKRPRPRSEVLPARRIDRLDLRWLRVLVLERRSAAFIARTFENSDLPVPSVEELAGIQETLNVPKNFRPTSTSHKPSIAFVEKLGLTPYFRNTPEWRGARHILDSSSRMRALVEAGLIAGVPTKDLVEVVRLTLREELSEHDVALYSRMFFDVGSTSRSVLRALVATRVRLAVLRSLGADADERVVAQLVESDGRCLAATLPSCSKVAWCSVLLALGHAPSRIDLPRMLDHVGDLAAMRAGAMVLRGGAGDEEVAERYAGVLVKLRQVRATINVPDEELHKRLAKIALRTDDQSVLTASELLARGDGLAVNNLPLARTVTTQMTTSRTPRRSTSGRTRARSPPRIDRRPG